MNFEPVVSFVNSTYLSPYHRWFRNPFCQLEISDDYSLPQFFQWGFNTKWYLLQFRKILMFFLFCFRHHICLRGLFETSQNACYVPGGDATIREKILYKYHSSAPSQTPCLFANICNGEIQRGY